MNERLRIAIGLALFVAVVTFPVWKAFGSAAQPAPELAKAVRGTSCVESPEWMAANHQRLLSDWRQAVVRDGRTMYTASDGAEYEMSLSKTCLSCHEDEQTFCTRCHDYADVEPTCWNCHLDPSREVTQP